MIYEPKFMHPTNYKMKSALKNDFNINFKQPNIRFGQLPQNTTSKKKTYDEYSNHYTSTVS